MAGLSLFSVDRTMLLTAILVGGYPMRLACLAIALALSSAPALAAEAVPTVEVGPATPQATQPAIPAATSAVIITLGTTGDFERKTVRYGCTGGEVDSLAVDYINAAPNYLALVPIQGSVLVFNTVLSGSGAKYAAGKFIWWTKGSEASLYDLTQGANAKPILTCTATELPP